jgi:hypothetical protein
MIFLSLFYYPISPQTPGWSLWLMIPLCLSLSIVYKTVRTKELKYLLREISALMILLIAGLVGLGAGIWILLKIFI